MAVGFWRPRWGAPTSLKPQGLHGRHNMNTQTQLFTNTNKNINSNTRLHYLYIFETIYYKRVEVGCTQPPADGAYLGKRWVGTGQRARCAAPEHATHHVTLRECVPQSGWVCPLPGLSPVVRLPSLRRSAASLGGSDLYWESTRESGCDMAANQPGFKRLGAWAGWWRGLCSRSSTGG